MGPDDAGTSPEPIDRPVLERIRSRFVGRRLFESVAIVEVGNRHLRAELPDDYYPRGTSARLEIRWYRNDDFTVHYREERRDGVWQCRWDRHPNPHNARDHFHPPPVASRTDATDAQWPGDHRNVCRLVLDRVEERTETLWDQL